MKSYLIILAIIITLVSCQSNQSSKPMTQTSLSNHEVLVKEVLQVNGYTYLRVRENQKELWLATPPVNAQEGDTYYYQGGFEMTNFKSKELNRTFESILFLEGISPDPISENSENAMISPGATTVKEGKKDIKITPEEGTITIAELYNKRDSYSEKNVKVKGEVTKFSPEIMETNWIHIQDGTESDGFFDLTITSKEKVSPGDIVVFEGKVIVDKDLGYGYFYEVLLEDARIIK
jgi:hypothetical protein